MFRGPGRGNRVCVPLTGKDERPSVRETHELTEALPDHVINVASSEVAYEMNGKRRFGDVLEFNEDVQQLRRLERIDLKNKERTSKLIQTLVSVGSQIVKSGGSGYTGVTPQQLYLRNGQQVVFLPGISNPNRWPELVVPYLAGEVLQQGATAQDIKEHTLCGNIVRVLFYLVHGVFRSREERITGRESQVASTMGKAAQCLSFQRAL